MGLLADDVVVSFIGQIRLIKGIDLFIRMAQQIRGPSVKFLICGECRDTEKFEGSYTTEDLLAEIAGDSRIKYVGYREDVQNIYRSSDIIVMPSRWEEPFGLINIEAGAARKTPSLQTRDGGIPEVIRHGENGFLVERDDLASLVTHTKLLVENREVRLQMGCRGRDIVEERLRSGQSGSRSKGIVAFSKTANGAPYNKLMASDPTWGVGSSGKGDHRFLFGENPTEVASMAL